jgi:hypothetical protein
MGYETDVYILIGCYIGKYTDLDEKDNTFIKDHYDSDNYDNKINVFLHQKDYRDPYTEAYLKIKIYTNPETLDLDKLQDDLVKCKELLNTDKYLKFDVNDVKIYVLTVYS